VDFVHDELSTGRKLRVLTIVDPFSRFSPAIDPRFSCCAEDVVATIDRVCAVICFPKMIRVDQGSEFVSGDLDPTAYANGVTLDFSRSGKRTDDAFIQAFNDWLRAECLNITGFISLADAREKSEVWGRYHN
jgi:putative transposase